MTKEDCPVCLVPSYSGYIEEIKENLHCKVCGHTWNPEQPHNEEQEETEFSPRPVHVIPFEPKQQIQHTHSLAETLSKRLRGLEKVL